MILLRHSEKKGLRSLSDYEEMKERLEKSFSKEAVRARILAEKREEKRAIKSAGGGHRIAKQILAGRGDHDTDFNFGANTDVQNSEPDIPPQQPTEPDDRCMGSVVCKRCGRFHGYCVELKEEKENLKMLPTGNDSNAGGRKREGAMRWLKVADLSTTPKEAKILMVRNNPDGRFGGVVELKMAFEGAIVYWSIPPKKGTTNWDLLLEKFGPEENEWIDKRILFYLEKNAFTDQFYIRVDVAKPAATNRRG